MGAAWLRDFVIPYGDSVATLGVSPGGDGLLLGPDYGAQGHDGTWWFLDAAKARVAHFADSGEYLDQVELSPDLLVDGTYFQYQLPRILEDGTLVAVRLQEFDTSVLVVQEATARAVTLPEVFAVKADDGELLYGFDGSGSMVVADLAALSVTGAEWFRTRSGERFRLTAQPGRLRLELPDADPPQDLSLDVVALEEPGGPAFFFAELASGEDGTIHLLLVGSPQANESIQVGGYLSITADGSVGPVEPVRNPFSPADPGSPAHLGVAPGGTTPWLMFVDEDGVHVFERVAYSY